MGLSICLAAIRPIFPSFVVIDFPCSFVDKLEDTCMCNDEEVRIAVVVVVVIAEEEAVLAVNEEMLEPCDCCVSKELRLLLQAALPLCVRIPP